MSGRSGRVIRAISMVALGGLLLACAPTRARSGEAASTGVSSGAPRSTPPPSGAEQTRAPSVEPDGAAGPDIALRRLSDRVWLHDSSFVLPKWGRVHANGLIVLGRDGAVIVDSAWTDAQTAWLLDQAVTLSGKQARALVATHFHEDRAGGIATARAAGVAVYALAETKRILATDDVTHPVDAEAAIDLGDVRLEIYFPGAGHSPDNAVVYVREERLLFGGCLVRAADHDIGNLSDADVGAWPATMDRLIARYGEAAVVVPGHGDLGDASLLSHTRDLARAAAAAGPSTP